MSISDKLTYLSGTKAAIKDAIEQKGVSVPSETTFREYADKISEISGGGGGIEYPKWVNSVWSEYVTATSVSAPSFAAGVIEAGDRLLLTLMTRREPNSVPSGFTEVLRTPIIENFGQFMIVYTKVATGSEGSFQVTLSGTADRTCLNVAAFRGTVTPEIVKYSSELRDTSTQPNNTIDLGQVTNPSEAVSGAVIIGITTSLANTADIGAEACIPFYGWASFHNTYGTSANHSNRMLLNYKQLEAGESVPAYTPRVALANADGLSLYKMLLAVSEV